MPHMPHTLNRSRLCIINKYSSLYIPKMSWDSAATPGVAVNAYQDYFRNETAKFSDGKY
jgi:hypothetical protein